MAPRALSPDAYCRFAWDIDPARLRDRGYEAILIDLDNTLVPRDEQQVPAEALAWAGRVEQAGLAACLVSNNWHDRVEQVAGELGFAFISKALKPFPQAFGRACKMLEVDPQRAVVVGDQVFTDVLGGHLAGIKTVLVPPLAKSDLPHTVLLRRLEAAIMAGREPVEQYPEVERKGPAG